MNATVRWTVARDGSTERNLNFLFCRKCKQVLVPLLQTKAKERYCFHACVNIVIFRFLCYYFYRYEVIV